MINKFRSTRRWMNKQIRRCRNPPEERRMTIGPPTNFRREEFTLGSDGDGNAMLIKQAREDAFTMHKASKMQGLKNHARTVSAKFGQKEQLLEGNMHRSSNH